MRRGSGRPRGPAGRCADGRWTGRRSGARSRPAGRGTAARRPRGEKRRAIRSRAIHRRRGALDLFLVLAGAALDHAPTHHRLRYPVRLAFGRVVYRAQAELRLEDGTTREGKARPLRGRRELRNSPLESSIGQNERGAGTGEGSHGTSTSAGVSDPAPEGRTSGFERRSRSIVAAYAARSRA